MKPLLLTLYISSFGLFFSAEEKTVYICNSETGKKYHLEKTCRGLNACNHEVKEITLTKAKSNGKTLCGWED